MGGSPQEAAVSWYYDPLPTNCVADWVCAGGSGTGYPQWAYQPGAEHGYMNLAVFYEACTFDCLFCQNWHYREQNRKRILRTCWETNGSMNPREHIPNDCFFGELFCLF